MKSLNKRIERLERSKGTGRGFTGYVALVNDDGTVSLQLPKEDGGTVTLPDRKALESWRIENNVNVIIVDSQGEAPQVE